MHLDNAIDEFALHLKKQGKGPATINAYCHDAHSFKNFLEQYNFAPKDLSPDILADFQDYLRNRSKEQLNSIRRTTIGIKVFFRFLMEARTIPNSPFELFPIPNRQNTRPTTIATDSIRTILAKCGQSALALKGHRDATILALLAFDGLKASELINLRWNDLIQNTECCSLRIRGTHDRVILLGRETTEVLDDYLAIAKNCGIESKVETIFCSFKGPNPTTPSGPLSRHGLKFVLYELGLLVGYEKLNSEILRTHAITYLIELGHTIDKIQIHLGLRQAGKIAKLVNG